VWSVWGDVWDLYVCRGKAWVGRRGERILEVSVPASMPLERLLQKVGENLPPQKGRQRMRIALSSAYCVPLKFDVPRGAKRDDIRALALRSAARYWEVESSAVACAADPAVEGLAAAMPASVKQLLLAWVRSMDMQCKSIRPMWALAAGFSQLGQSQIYALVEVDGASTIGIPNSAATALTVELTDRSSALTSPGRSDESAPASLVWTPPTLGDSFGKEGWAPFFPLMERKS